ncbi:MAG: TIGR04282 family arsenosugar biosynthesis glycosyltransferase [Bacteroidota bacterium]|nr:TIGR04282 family arsenosugar biosynthesis glycosyltransferase [Bacteroidota bacterium]
MKEVLIIFAKNPEYGKVKTRLAATIGNEQALFIYQKLIEHTIAITKKISADKIVFYSDSIVEKDTWENNIYQKKLQSGNDLEDRMKNAFKSSFTAGYDKVIIIGTDCFELNEEFISIAFEKMNDDDVVLGPAKDGGYYLLGMKKFYPSLFENIEWSSEKVLKQTLSTAMRLNLSVFLLPPLSDIDREPDLKDYSALFTKNKK